MSDKITVKELKVFLGTGLMIRTEVWNNFKDGIDYVSCEKLGHESFDYVINGYDEDCFKSLKPIVRPWSHLTKEIEVDGVKLVPIKAMTSIELYEEDWPEVLEGVRRSVISGRASFGITMKYAAMGFDIFGWLGRTGADGLPLAVEMKDNA